MAELDFDDPTVEKNWYAGQRARVLEYLDRQNLKHGGVAEHPAWLLAPYVSIWPVQSLKNPKAIGWWAISGDCPTDYISSASADTARSAMRAFADQWDEVANCLANGIDHPQITIGPPEMRSELAPILQRRAKILRQFADDDGAWPSPQ